MITEANSVMTLAGIDIKKVVKVPKAYNAYISLPSLSHPRGWLHVKKGARPDLFKLTFVGALKKIRPIITDRTKNAFKKNIIIYSIANLYCSFFAVLVKK